jgi:hypothetical protein
VEELYQASEQACDWRGERGEVGFGGLVGWLESSPSIAQIGKIGRSHVQGRQDCAYSGWYMISKWRTSAGEIAF